MGSVTKAHSLKLQASLCDMTQILWGTQILCWMLLMQNIQISNKKLLHQSIECQLGTSLCQKHWIKTIPSKLVIFSNLLNSMGRKLEQQNGVHGYLSWWLGTRLWHCDRTQVASDWARGGDSKLIKDWLKQCKVLSQSFYVSSGVAFPGNNDLWKILLVCESFRLRWMQW